MKRLGLLNVVVGLTGVVVIALGLNVGLGGIRTLGWQVPQDFVAVADAAAFAAQDSHVRFLGGVWFGLGVLFLAGAFMLERFRSLLIGLCGVAAIAGLFRISGMDGVLPDAGIAPSMLFELVGFPMLALWLARGRTAAVRA